MTKSPGAQKRPRKAAAVGPIQILGIILSENISHYELWEAKEVLHMKRIIGLVLALGILLAPVQGLAAPKKGVTTKNLVSRFESALKFLNTAVAIKHRKLKLESVKREDGRKEFASTEDEVTGWTVVGITFPKSDIIEDVVFFTDPALGLVYEYQAFLSALSARGSAKKRLDDGNKITFNMGFHNTPPAENGVQKLVKNHYEFSQWGVGDVWYYRLRHEDSELGEAWRVEKGILQPIEVPQPSESPAPSESPGPQESPGPSASPP